MEKKHLSQTSYDWSSKFVRLWSPAFITLYLGLSQLWEFPETDKVVGSIALITAFLGIVLGISSKRYADSDDAYDGQIVISQDELGKKTFSLELAKMPEDLESMKKVSFKVNK